MQAEHREFYSAAPIVTVLALVRLGLGRLGLALLQTRFCSRCWPECKLSGSTPSGAAARWPRWRSPIRSHPSARAPSSACRCRRRRPTSSPRSTPRQRARGVHRQWLNGCFMPRPGRLPAGNGKFQHLAQGWLNQWTGKLVRRPWAGVGPGVGLN